MIEPESESKSIQGKIFKVKSKRMKEEMENHYFLVHYSENSLNNHDFFNFMGIEREMKFGREILLLPFSSPPTMFKQLLKVSMSV